MLGELVVLINFLYEVLEFYESTQFFNVQLESIFFGYFLTEKLSITPKNDRLLPLKFAKGQKSLIINFFVIIKQYLPIKVR